MLFYLDTLQDLYFTYIEQYRLLRNAFQQTKVA